MAELHRRARGRPAVPAAAARTADVTGARRTLKAIVGLGLVLWLAGIATAAFYRVSMITHSCAILPLSSSLNTRKPSPLVTRPSELQLYG